MIRPYNEKDRADIERICLPENSNSTLYDEAILKCFCAYYIENSPKCCFVATDGEDRAIGYILCAPDFYEWKERFNADYIAKSNNPYLKAMGSATAEALEPFAREYPAHLHIDIGEGYRGQHLGTHLIACLVEKLKALKVCGLMLDVANDNAAARKFYEKRGFTTLCTGKNETVMGMKL